MLTGIFPIVILVFGTSGSVILMFLVGLLLDRFGVDVVGHLISLIIRTGRGDIDAVGRLLIRTGRGGKPALLRLCRIQHPRVARVRYAAQITMVPLPRRRPAPPDTHGRQHGRPAVDVLSISCRVRLRQRRSGDREVVLDGDGGGGGSPG